jgi:peptidoglycan/LPS O-acetylase OafA/YrhL
VRSGDGAARFDSIDALRGLAITLVIIYHAGPLAWRLAPYRSDGWLAWPSLGAKWLLVPFFHFGFAGVHAFFVLSGFCIHLRAARLRAAGAAATIDLRSYALRRFWRIYPPYWIALLGFGLLLPLVMGRPIAAGDLLLHAGMLHTFSERSFFAINPAFWSLATEEQFYLAYPLVLAALSRWGTRRVLLSALALSLIWRGATLALLPPTEANFMAWRVLVHGLFLPRWFEWLLGCWMAELAVSPSRPLDGKAPFLSWTAASLLLLAMLSRVHVAADKLLSDALFGAGFAAITGAVLSARPVGSKIARTFVLFLRAMGRRAYGLYLVHQPILDWAGLPRLATLPSAVAAGWLFSRVFERPFEKRSQRVARRESSPVSGARVA